MVVSISISNVLVPLLRLGTFPSIAKENDEEEAFMEAKRLREMPYTIWNIFTKFFR